MAMNDISGSVQATEAEAERLLEEAKARANEILVRSREEAKKIVSSELPMDEVEEECRRIVREATAEAEEKTAASVRKASEVRAHAESKAPEIVDRIVTIITGAKAA